METEIERLEALVRIVKKAVTEAPKGDAESPTVRRAATVLTEMDEVLAAEVKRVRAAFDKEVERAAAEDRRERESCGKVLERLLLPHDPPGTSWSLRLGQKEGKGRYDANLGTTEFGLRWTVELDIPNEHVLGHVVRVEELVPHLEVSAPRRSAG